MIKESGEVNRLMFEAIRDLVVSGNRIGNGYAAEVVGPGSVVEFDEEVADGLQQSQSLLADWRSPIIFRLRSRRSRASPISSLGAGFAKVRKTSPS